MSARDLVSLLRVKQWSKNLLVFAALIFTGRVVYPDDVTRTVLAFAGFCLLSSAVYIFNDWRDRERDRLHPRKQHRPLAAGRVPASIAFIIAAVSLGGGLTLLWYLGQNVLLWGSSYLLLQALYIAVLRDQPLLDVFAIATGFIIRAEVGAAALNAEVSGWLLLCTLALALMLGFSKRRQEFLQHPEAIATIRPSLRGFRKEALDALVMVSATVACLGYGVYALESATAASYPRLIWTFPFVIYGVYRYLYLVLAHGEGQEPETVLLKDLPTLITVAGFIAVSIYVVGWSE